MIHQSPLPLPYLAWKPEGNSQVHFQFLQFVQQELEKIIVNMIAFCGIRDNFYIVLGKHHNIPY